MCITKDIKTKEVKTWERPDLDPKELNEYLKGSFLIGHNILWYDLPVLNRLCKSGLDPEKVVDTLVVSRLVNSWDYNLHGLEAWGERLEFPKGDFKQFTHLTPEMVEYCKNDVELTERIYLFLKRFIDDPSLKASMVNEHRAAIICTEMHYNGFGFNIENAKKLHKEISELRDVLDKEIQEAFPPRSYLIREVLPRPTVKGAISAVDFRWLDTTEKTIEEHGYSVGATFSRIDFEPFNPASPKQCIERLNEFGWKPFEKTKGHIKAERDKDYEKLENYKKFGWTISEDNLATLPPTAPAAAQKLVRHILLTRRLTTLDEWIFAYNERTKSIHGQINAIGTWTHRSSHKAPNTGNIIRIQTDKEGHPLFGEDGGWGADYRSLWMARPGYKLVGCDAEGIQLRVLAHYMEDESFTKALVSGSSKDGTDVHTLNKNKLGIVCKDRNAAKTFIYSWVLGASATKTAAVLECSVGEAVVARESFLNGYPGLKRVKEEVIPEDVKMGQFIGFDGRIVKCDSNHLMLAGYLQNGEVCIMKYANWLWRKKLKEEKINFRQVNFIHDEWQTEVIDKEGLPEYVGQIQADAIVQAGKDLGVKCPQAGTFRTGYNWCTTH